MDTFVHARRFQLRRPVCVLGEIREIRKKSRFVGERCGIRNVAEKAVYVPGLRAVSHGPCIVHARFRLHIIYELTHKSRMGRAAVTTTCCCINIYCNIIQCLTGLNNILVTFKIVKNIIIRFTESIRVWKINVWYEKRKLQKLLL